jgi:hypothetical protein
VAIAIGVTLATIVVCILGISAELGYTKKSQSERAMSEQAGAVVSQR